MDFRTLLVLFLTAFPFSFLKARDLQVSTMTLQNSDTSHLVSSDSTENIPLKLHEISFGEESP